MTKKELVALVIEQIIDDVENKDLTAIVELLDNCPETDLKNYLFGV